ncbi:unnamed protein product, partial [marine sediment metagenome]
FPKEEFFLSMLIPPCFEWNKKKNMVFLNLF